MEEGDCCEVPGEAVASAEEFREEVVVGRGPCRTLQGVVGGYSFEIINYY